MRFDGTTKKAISRDLYKVCASAQTKEIIGKYHQASNWRPEDIIKSVSEACLQRTSLEEVCEAKENPSADTVLRRIRQLQLEQLDQMVNGWINDNVQRIKFHGNTKLTVAIDFHQQPYYGDPSVEWVVGMKRKKGTSYCICFVLVTIATGRICCPVYVKLVTKKEYADKVGLLAQLWYKLPVGLNIRRVFMDRWFCDDAVIGFLEDLHLEYVIAARRVTSVKKTVREVQACIEQLAAFAGVRLEDKREVGQWCRRRGLDT